MRTNYCQPYHWIYFDVSKYSLRYPCNKNQHDALFIFSLFQKLTCTCFKQIDCSSSGGTTLYIQHLVYVMLKKMDLFKIT